MIKQKFNIIINCCCWFSDNIVIYAYSYIFVLLDTVHYYSVGLIYHWTSQKIMSSDTDPCHRHDNELAIRFVALVGSLAQ